MLEQMKKEDKKRRLERHALVSLLIPIGVLKLSYFFFGPLWRTCISR